jgi:two-component system chemotaxis response regulator CheB
MNDSSPNARVISVLVTDDSAFMRTALTRMIVSDPALRVVGTAVDGIDALDKISSLDPDVVTLDVEMPRMNGLETLKRIMSELPRPVIMVSSITQEGAVATLEALEYGAFDYIPKDLSYASLDIVKIRDDLIAKIKVAAERRRPRPPRRAPLPTPTKAAVVQDRGSVRRCPAIVSIGTSTGGPKALQQILPMLPADLPVGIVIVQHMPVGFTGPFAQRLNNLCKVRVKEASPNELVEPGTVYIAPAGYQMSVYGTSFSKAAIAIRDTPRDLLHIPSVDVMMLSVAEVFRNAAMGIILTGMGGDGALGMQAIARYGGLTVGQDEATCAVYGMPRTCAEMGVLGRVVPLEQVPEQILFATRYHSRRA